MKLSPACPTGIAPALLLSAVLLAGIIPVPAAANPPSAVVLSYNQFSSVLSVTITHPIRNFKNHYIREVNLTVNGNVVNDSTYTGQASDTVTYTYPLALRPGDVVEATAVCSIAGSGTGKFIMPGPTATAPDASDQPAAAPTQKASAPVIAAVAGTGVLLAIRKRG
jgi:hypothetical protein